MRYTSIKINNKISAIYIILIMFALHFATVAGAMEAQFAPSYQSEETTLELSGVGVLRYLGLVRIYNGALYLPPEVGKENVLSDIPKRLEVTYLRSFKGKDFGRATIKGMKKNVDRQTLTRLEPKITYHNALYEDVEKGDRMSLTYIPAKGTEVAINGKTKGMIPGTEFASALFSLWLGDKPFDRQFKASLLGEFNEKR